VKVVAKRAPVAVVTGASSGVGRAVARALGERGYLVGLLARGVEALQATAREVEARGGAAIVLPVDVSDAEAVARAADRVAAAGGAIDVWINNAMVSVFSPVVEMSPDEYRRMIEVNYLGYVHGTLAALRHMRPRNAGHIIQIGSALAYRSIPLQSAYCASKAAIRAFTDSLRCELVHERSRIRVSALHLPAINTPQFAVVRNRLPYHPQPVPPIYQPEIVARAVLSLLGRPRREMWLGWSTVKAIVAQTLVPRLADRYLGRTGYRANRIRASIIATTPTTSIDRCPAIAARTESSTIARAPARARCGSARTARRWPCSSPPLRSLACARSLARKRDRQ
jgi:short-subunit dehydrogenase